MTSSSRVLLSYSGQPPLLNGRAESFDLHPGETLCLHIGECLSHKQEVELVHSLGREVGLAAPACIPRLALRAPTVIRYLKQRLNKNDDSGPLLQRLELTGTEDLRTLPFTTRVLLGLEVAFQHHRAVAFSVSGLDPIGVKKVLSYVPKLLNDSCAILLSYPSSLGHEYEAEAEAPCTYVRILERE